MEPIRLAQLYNVFGLAYTSNVDSPIDVVDVRRGSVIFTDIARSRDAVLISKTSFAIESLKNIKDNITTSYLGYLNGWQSGAISLDKREILKLIDIRSHVEMTLRAMDFELSASDESDESRTNCFAELGLNTWFYTPSSSSPTEGCRYLVRDVGKDTSKSRLVCSATTAEDASFAVLTPNILSLLFAARDFMECVFISLDTERVDTVLDFSNLEEDAAFWFNDEFLREFAQSLGDLFKKRELIDFLKSIEEHKKHDRI